MGIDLPPKIGLCAPRMQRIDEAQKKSSQSRHLYSHLSATDGSTRVARRAGTYVASAVTTSSRNATEAKVSGSSGLTPKSRLVRAGDSAAAATVPSTIPIRARVRLALPTLPP